jgi:DeoR/GlpR family transcriptional regulator of sugar metabolism
MAYGNTSAHAETESAGKREREAQDRRQRILALLAAAPDNALPVNELTEALGVSVATVRRDLAALSEADAVARTYGGAVLAPGRLELAMSERQRLHAGEKSRIARRAVSMLSAGDVVILDAGTTAECVAAEIANELELTVVTNGIRCVVQLVPQDKVHVLVLGGSLRSINETICGGEAEAMLERIYGNYAFIGADAVDPAKGIASRTYDQGRLKSLMLTHAEHVYVIADSSKLRVPGTFTYWSKLPREWNIITDSGADEEDLDRLRRSGARQILLA